MSNVIDISGGAGPEEAVAITAVIAQVIEEALAAAARPEQVPRPNSWVQSGRLRTSDNPMTTHAYDAQPWVAAAAVED